MGSFQERFRLPYRQDEGQLSRLLHGRQGSRGIAGAEFLSRQAAVETINHRDAAGEDRAGGSACVESGNVVQDLRQDYCLT